MCDSAEESFVGKILVDKLREKIPGWFDESDSKLLLSALENSELGVDFETLMGLVESMAKRATEDIFDKIFKEDVPPATDKGLGISDETFEILWSIVEEIRSDQNGQEDRLEIAIKDCGKKIALLTQELNRLKKKVKFRKSFF